MLAINGLKVRRGKQILAYDFELAAGLILTIQGRSGAGKSTLLDVIAGFVQPACGDVRWHNKSILPLAVEQRPVSMLFQSNNLFEHLTIMKNLHFGLVFECVDERDKAISAAAAQLEVADLLTRKPSELSGGQRQRIALLRTLLRPEPIVLLDEPFTGLDNRSRELAADWVMDSARHFGKTVLLVTHQDDDVQRIADLNLHLDDSVGEMVVREVS